MAENVKTSKGRSVFIHNGFIFQRERISNDKVFWVCGNRSFCKSKLHTIEGTVVKEVNEHTHNVNHSRLVSLAGIAAPKRKLRWETVDQQIQNVVDGYQLLFASN